MSGRPLPRLGRRWVVLAEALALACLFALTLSSSADARLRSCGTVNARNAFNVSPFRVKAQGLSCTAAKGVTKNYWRRHSEDAPGDRVRLGRFTCKRISYFSPPGPAWTCFHHRQRATAYWAPETNDFRAHSARTIRCADVNVDTGPAKEGSATNVRASNLSCRTARRAVRYLICYDRPPRGWKLIGYYSGLRNGRWLVRFRLAGGVGLC